MANGEFDAIIENANAIVLVGEWARHEAQALKNDCQLIHGINLDAIFFTCRKLLVSKCMDVRCAGEFGAIR